MSLRRQLYYNNINQQVRSINYDEIPTGPDRKKLWWEKIFFFDPIKGFTVDSIGKAQQPLNMHLSALKNYFSKQASQKQAESERFIEARHKILGPDLATAHFVIARGGSVKLINSDRWHVRTETGNIPLPNIFVEGLFVEALDCSDCKFIYESFDNFVQLRHLKYLSLRRCPNIDDWCLDRFVQFRDSLKVLDLSECPLITHRGLACLSRLTNLTRLQLFNMPAVQNRPLIKLLLEEAMHNCYIEGLTEEEEVSLKTAQTAPNSFRSPFQQTLDKIASEAAIVEKNKQFVDSTKHFALVDSKKLQSSHQLKQKTNPSDGIFYN